MKKLNTNEFINRAKEVHGDKYDYSKVEYVNSQTKVCIICPEHGEFWQKPYNHLNGNGCPSCIKTKWNTELFIKKAKEIHGDKYDYSKTVFKSVRDKVCIILNEKDRNGKTIGEFWQYPLVHLGGAGCNKEKRGIKDNCWEDRICPVCGKVFKVRKKHEKITCSEECRKKYIEIHKDEINEKKSQKMCEIYKTRGKEYFENIRKKTEETCLRKYGATNFSKTEEGRKICSENMKKTRKKIDEYNKINVLIPKYEKICENDNIELVEFRNRFDCLLRCKQCGNVFTSRTLGYLTEKTNSNLCRICHPITYKNNMFESDFEKFLYEEKINYKKNYRNGIGPLEIDYYLPDYKIGFELDGIYWHCELFRDNDYHITKTDKCTENGIRLIHIFEDEWKNKKEICKSRILNVIGKTETRIFARKCVVKEVNKTETRKFLNENHIQGYSVCKYSFGLYYEDELVSIMTFGKLRRNLGYNKNIDGKYEMIRFCNKLYTNVIGGASKLMKYFINEIKPISIVSYADRRWSDGGMYKTLGFEFIKNTKPNYFYVINGERKNRFEFRKNILVEKYGCPIEMTEKEFCIQKKWYRIYDCGTNVYEYKF